MLDKIYKLLEKKHRTIDAKKYIINTLVNYTEDTIPLHMSETTDFSEEQLPPTASEETKKRFNLLRKTKRKDFESIAEQFMETYNADMTENQLWEACIDEFCRKNDKSF